MSPRAGGGREGTERRSEGGGEWEGMGRRGV